MALPTSAVELEEIRALLPSRRVAQRGACDVLKGCMICHDGLGVGRLEVFLFYRVVVLYNGS